MQGTESRKWDQAVKPQTLPLVCPSARAPPPRGFVTLLSVPPAGDQVFKHTSLWGTLLLQTTPSPSSPTASQAKSFPANLHSILLLLQGLSFASPAQPFRGRTTDYTVCPILRMQVGCLIITKLSESLLCLHEHFRMILCLFKALALSHFIASWGGGDGTILHFTVIS